eukprot:266746_1
MLLSSDRVGVNRSIRMNRRKTSTQYGLRYMKKLSFLVVAMGAILLVTNAISIRQSQHYVINVWQNNFYSNTTPQPQSDESTTDPPEEAQYKTFSSFVGIPNFYTKDPHQPVAPNGNLLTICSMCSLNILPQSKALATNYQSGPLSLAVYIDSDITHHTQLRSLLFTLFNQCFHNLSIPFGLIYCNKSSPFWKQLRITNETSMAWKLPYNALRNLAEYQVQTKWLMNVDLDFELYSSTMHDSVYLNTMLGDADTYSNHTIFIVPAFALNSSYVEEGTDYNNLTRTQLISLIPKQISPFGKTCLHYSKWYKTQSDYTLDLSDLKHCRPRHEPFFIMNSNISREYSWDTRFAATQSLRHHNFIAIVLRDVFMIQVKRAPILYSRPFNTSFPLSHIPEQKALSLKELIRQEKWHRERDPNANKCGFEGKVFVLGASKTGTKTMGGILSTLLGYHCTYQPMHTCGFHPLDEYYQNSELALSVAPDDISWIFHSPLLYNDFIQSLKQSRSFSDLPWAFLYPLYDQLIPPGYSKFILLVRDSTRDVVNSNMKMLARRDSVQFDYTNHTVHPRGIEVKWETFWMLNARQYEMHNRNVIEYFTKRNRLKDLLILNVAQESKKNTFSEQWFKITNFLQCDNITDRSIPHHNQAVRKQMDFFPKNYSIQWQDFEFPEEMKNIWKVVKVMNGTYDEHSWNMLKDGYGKAFSTKRKPTFEFDDVTFEL